MDDLAHAKIGNIVASLHESKQHYGLVVDAHTSSIEQKIRGIFSLWEISHRIGEDLHHHII